MKPLRGHECMQLKCRPRRNATDLAPATHADVSTAYISRFLGGMTIYMLLIRTSEVVCFDNHELWVQPRVIPSRYHCALHVGSID